MSIAVINRRAVLGGAAGVAVVAGLPAAAVAAVAPPDEVFALARTIAAWVRLRPDAGASVRLALLDARGRALCEFAPIALESGDAAAASLWRRAREAGASAERLAAAALASGWGAPVGECEIRTGEIAHAPSGRAMRRVVWIDVV